MFLLIIPAVRFSVYSSDFSLFTLNQSHFSLKVAAQSVWQASIYFQKLVAALKGITASIMTGYYARACIRKH